MEVFRRRAALRSSAVVAVAALLSVGCASFADPATTFSDQAALTPTIATVAPPIGQLGAAPEDTAPSEPAESNGSDGDGPADPCAPPALPVVAVCLDDPVGLAPLPDGMSALVGERTSGRVLRVAPQAEPEVVAVIDAAKGGALRDLALSPSFIEDQLVFAAVTTATDDRVLRFPLGGDPTAIITGLPRSTTPPGPDGSDSGGLIIFDAADNLLVTTADRQVLRFDQSGNPAADELGGPVAATGLTDPTGMCPLPEGRVGIVDHRPEGDALVVLGTRPDFSELVSGDTLWTFSRGDGGAVDCAISDNALLATSERDAAVTRIEMRGADSFTGIPERIVEGDFGYLDMIVTGPGDLVWLTTRNLVTEPALEGFPEPSDDRVLLLPPSGGGGGDGGAD